MTSFQHKELCYSIRIVISHCETVLQYSNHTRDEMYLLIQVSNDHGESGTADPLHLPEISPLMWRRANLRTMVKKK